MRVALFCNLQGEFSSPVGNQKLVSSRAKCFWKLEFDKVFWLGLSSCITSHFQPFQLSKNLKLCHGLSLWTSAPEMGFLHKRDENEKECWGCFYVNDNFVCQFVHIKLLEFRSEIIYFVSQFIERDSTGNSNTRRIHVICNRSTSKADKFMQKSKSYFSQLVVQRLRTQPDDGIVVGSCFAISRRT